MPSIYDDCEVVKLRKGNVAYVRDGELVARSCTKCGATKDANEYSNKKSIKFGKETNCKTCCSLRNAKWREENDEHLRKYYDENREKRRVSASNWKRQNKERVASNMRKYRAENPQRFKGYQEGRVEYLREWRKGNIERIRALDILYAARRRARKKELPNTLSPLAIEELASSFGGCALTGSTDYHLDHVIPLATGHGGTIIGNMMPLRGDLNTSKGAKNVFMWFNAVRERECLSQERFNAMISYLAEQNGMTVFEYTAYVYECHMKEE